MAKYRNVPVCTRCSADGKAQEIAHDDDGPYCVNCGDADNLQQVKERVMPVQVFEEIDEE
jgi:hypothetical protein